MAVALKSEVAYAKSLFCACQAFVFGDGGGKRLRSLVGGNLEKRPPDPEKGGIVFGQECDQLKLK